MVTMEEPGGSFLEDEQVEVPPEHPFKFITTKRGKKVLVMDGYIFHFHSKFKASSYFKCFHRKKGCGAAIALKNWNQERCTFDSYLIRNNQHLNHLPDPDKILKKEEQQNKVLLLEKAQVDLKSPEFRNSKHVCLFCFSALPSNYLKNSVLENVVPYGHDLTISLDNPTKNSQAFDLLCSLLNVRWRRNHECRNFDQTIPLPLCLKCQSLYQEVFQLHVQIRELEILINKRIKVIRGLVERSGENESIEIGQTQLALLGLDNFRKKVKDANFNFGYDEKDTLSTSATSRHPPPSKVNTATTAVPKIEPEVERLPEDHPSSPSPTANLEHEQPIIKQEVNPEEEDPLEDNYEPPWIPEEVNLQENIPSAPPEDIKILPRTRSTRLAAQRASEKVALAVTSGSSDNDNEDNSADDSDGNPTDKSDTDTDTDTNSEIEIKLNPKKPLSRLSSISISRPIRYRPTLRPSSKYSPIKTYTCNICSKILAGLKSFSLHYSQEHPDKKRFTCKFCDKYYPEFREVLAHQRAHTGEKPFKCPHCPFSTSHRTSLPQHISNRHSNKKRSEIFSCPHCPKKFFSKTILSNHLVSSHEQAPSFKFYKRSGKPIRTFTCHLCDTKIHGQGPFAQHYTEFHPSEKKYTCKFCPAHFPYVREVINHQRRRHTGDRPFKCDQCSNTFSNERGLLSHQNYRHSQSPHKFQCPQCPKLYPTHSALKAHTAYHHRDSITFCKTCGKAFRHPTGFPSHNKKIHNGTAQQSQPVKDLESIPLEILESTLGISSDEDQRVKCHICWKLIISDKLFIQKHFDESHEGHKGTLNCQHCGKEFNRYRKCVDHVMRKHTNLPKGYQCDKCPNSYHSVTELKKHEKSHMSLEERMKEHVCDLCGIGMVSAYALNYHKKKHEEEGKERMKWVCEECGKSYTEKRGLLHHKKVVHRRELKWKCDKCDKAFVERTLLTRHERNHLGYKGFKCGMCEVAFVHPTSRTRHEREVHGVGGGEKGRKRKTSKRRGGKGEGIR